MSAGHSSRSTRVTARASDSTSLRSGCGSTSVDASLSLGSDNLRARESEHVPKGRGAHTSVDTSTCGDTTAVGTSSVSPAVPRAHGPRNPAGRPQRGPVGEGLERRRPNPRSLRAPRWTTTTDRFRCRRTLGVGDRVAEGDDGRAAAAHQRRRESPDPFALSEREDGRRRSLPLYSHLGPRRPQDPVHDSVVSSKTTLTQNTGRFGG